MNSAGATARTRTAGRAAANASHGNGCRPDGRSRRQDEVHLGGSDGEQKRGPCGAAAIDDVDADATELGGKWRWTRRSP